jgi:hypothetical protein
MVADFFFFFCAIAHGMQRYPQYWSLIAQELMQISSFSATVVGCFRDKTKQLDVAGLM